MQAAPQVDADAGVEGAERLVEQEDARPMREGAGQRDPLLLPSRQLRREPAAEAGEPDELQQLVPPAATFGAWNAPHGERELDVLGHRHAAEEGIALEDEAAIALLRRHAGEILAVEQDAPRIGGRRPAIRRRMVLLPLPEGPSRTQSRPFSTSSETFETTGRPS